MVSIRNQWQTRLPWCSSSANGQSRIKVTEGHATNYFFLCDKAIGTFEATANWRNGQKRSPAGLQWSLATSPMLNSDRLVNYIFTNVSFAKYRDNMLLNVVFNVKIPGSDSWSHTVWFFVAVTIAPGKAVVVRRGQTRIWQINKVTHHESAPNTLFNLRCRPGAKRLCSAATQAGRAPVHATAFTNTRTAPSARARTTAPASRGSGGAIPQRVKPC